jgi:hypothetical protein
MSLLFWARAAPSFLAQEVDSGFVQLAGKPT